MADSCRNPSQRRCPHGHRLDNVPVPPSEAPVFSELLYLSICMIAHPVFRFCFSIPGGVNRVGGCHYLASRPPTSAVRTGLVHGSSPVYGSKNRKTGIQSSQAARLRGLFSMQGWMLSASTPFRNWQEYPHFCWRFPASAGFSTLRELASISSKTPCGYVCASIHRYFGGIFPYPPGERTTSWIWCCVTTSPRRNTPWACEVSKTTRGLAPIFPLRHQALYLKLIEMNRK